MDLVLERKIFELPVDLRIDFFNKLEKLFQQEDEAMTGLIDKTRKSLRLSVQEFEKERSLDHKEGNTPSSRDTLRVTEINERPTTPVHLFNTSRDVDENKNNEKLEKESSDFKEERDEIMNRMNSEQKKLEIEKEKQAAILKNKMNMMANKMQETEVKADEMMKEADKVEKMDITERDKQATKLKEKLQKQKSKPFVIDSSQSND